MGSPLPASGPPSVPALDSLESEVDWDSLFAMDVDASGIGPGKNVAGITKTSNPISEAGGDATDTPNQDGSTLTASSAVDIATAPIASSDTPVGSDLQAAITEHAGPNRTATKATVANPMAANSRVVEPTTVKSTVAKPKAAGPTVAKSVGANSAVAKPKAAGPAITKSVATKSAVAKPIATKSAVGKPKATAANAVSRKRTRSASDVNESGRSSTDGSAHKKQKGSSLCRE